MREGVVLIGLRPRRPSGRSAQWLSRVGDGLGRAARTSGQSVAKNSARYFALDGGHGLLAGNGKGGHGRRSLQKMNIVARQGPILGEGDDAASTPLPPMIRTVARRTCRRRRTARRPSRARRGTGRWGRRRGWLPPPRWPLSRRPGRSPAVGCRDHDDGLHEGRRAPSHRSAKEPPATTMESSDRWTSSSRRVRQRSAARRGAQLGSLEVSGSGAAVHRASWWF